MADTNDITLGVGINATDAVTKAEELQNAIEEIFKASEGKQGSPAFQKMLVQLSNLYDKSKKAEQAVMEIGTAPTLDMSKITADLFPKESELESVKNEFADISSRIEELRAQGKAKEIAPEFKAITDRVRELRAELNGAKLLMQEFSEGAKRGNTNDAAAYGKEYENVQRLKLEIGQLEAVLNQMQKAGLDTQVTDEFREIAKEAITARKRIEELEEEIKELKADAEKLKAEGKDRTPLDNNADYGNAVNELSSINNKIANELNKNNAGNILQRNFGKSIVDIGNHLSQLPQMIENTMDEIARTLPPHIQVIYSVIKFGVKQIVGAYKEAFSEVSTVIKNGLTKAANVATTAVKALVKEVAKLASSAFLSPIKKLGDSISNIGKQANSSAPSLKQLGRMFLQYGLGARSLYRLINKLRTALFEGFADLALVDEPFNAAMSSIISSLEYLKNAFAAAFAPIIQAVAPALSAFINMIAEAVVWLGQLIALLTGQPFKIAVPTFKDYASSTSAGAAAAKNAAKAEKERAKALKKTAKEMRTIAGFDDVEILKAPEDKDSSSSSPSGGGGGGGGGGLAFQTAPISEGLQKFADMLKKIWETADAFDLGVLVSKKLGDLLKAFNAAVPNIQEVVTKIAKILASFLAGFFSVYETFVELGKAIGNVINIVFTGINEFLKEFMERNGFKNLGKDIYLTIMNALNTIDWDTIYSAFALMGIGLAQVLNETITKPELWEAVVNALCNALTALLLRAYNFVNTLKWGEIGTALAAGINAGIENFPFGLVSSTAASFINGIFTFLGNAAANIHWDELGHNIGKSVMDFFDRVDWKENGKSLGKFLQGLFDALKSFAETIKFEEIAQNIIDFIDGFFEKFDWKENADTLLGLLNDLLDYFLKTVNTIGWENIIGQIWDYIKNSPEVEKFLENIWNTITLIAAAKLQLKLMKFYLLGKMIIGGILNGIINALLSIGTWIETHIFKPIYDAIMSVFDMGSPSKKMEPIGGWILEGILQGIINAILNIGAWINEHIFTPIKDGIRSAFGISGDSAENVKDTGTSIIQGIWNGITEKLGAPLSWLQEHIATPIKGGLETAFGIAGGVASKIKEIGSAVVNGFKSGAEAETPKVNTSATEINEKMQTSLSAGDWDKIGSGVINKVKGGMDSVKSAITNTAQTIQKVVYDALENADWSKIGSTAINKVKSGMDSIKNAITSTAKSIQSAIYKALETADWSKIGSNAITKMKSGMDSIKSAITSVAKSIQETVYKTLETGDWTKIGSNTVTKVKEGMSQIRSTIIDTAKDIQSGIYEALNSGDWSDIGDNIVTGIWNGLNDGWDWLKDKVWNLAVDLFNAACRALDINSPSKLFADKVGAMIPAGIGIGITDNEKSATDSVETMAQSLVDTAKTIKLPPIAMGEIIPSNIANRNNNDQTTLSSLLNVLQSLQSEMVTKDELEELLTDMFREHMNIDFHIGDEKLARHVNRGNSLLDRRYNPIRN